MAESGAGAAQAFAPESRVDGVDQHAQHAVKLKIGRIHPHGIVSRTQRIDSTFAVLFIA